MYRSRFETHSAPAVDTIVERFGDIHGHDTVRDYAIRFLAINTCGQGVHPDDTERLFRHAKRTVEGLTERLVINHNVQPGDEGELTWVVDEATRTSLTGDEQLTAELMVAFANLWPDGRDTILA